MEIPGKYYFLNKSELKIWKMFLPLPIFNKSRDNTMYFIFSYKEF